ncbi:hypothetical protein HQO83_06530 [Rhodococcus fascians]|nr:hypothetical protein [Rhodococcus fascians]
MISTADGPAEYTPPIDLRADTLSSAQLDVAVFTAVLPGRSTASEMRLASELIGLPIHDRYLYPTLQFDVEARRIRDEVIYANRLLDAADDPWGALSWWFTPAVVLHDRPPVELLRSGVLSREATELTIAADSAGMG